jgi:GH15 family glucan-1,4-alpha-glucosidase
MALRLEDYAIVGDCQTVALVGRDGSIDWLCLPRFDSAACFAALLGDPENGRWQIAPSGASQVRRSYRAGTLILDTDFETPEGSLRLTDFMPPRAETPDLVRIVECTRGRVEVRMELIMRFDYGHIVPWVRRIDGGISAVAGPDTLRLETPAPLKGQNFTTVSSFTLDAGERIGFVLTWYPSHLPPPGSIDPQRAMVETERWWTEWCRQCRYQGRWAEAVQGSLLCLKALTYVPTGGIVASPTTSLPEKIGGVRNWDYRFCWLRDATFTLYALLTAGYQDEARAWREWLLRAVAGNPSQIQIMYGLAGERRLTEIELGWLPGYERSAPVRIGNDAHSQFQLDVFGELMDAFYLSHRSALAPQEESWRLQHKLLEFLESRWEEPDNGLWEVRGPRRQFTHSKVMAWVALDRAVRTVTRYGLDGPLAHWRKLRSLIHEQVCREGFSAERNSFVQYYGSNALDASLLQIPLVGFLPPEDPRVKGTVEAIQRHLSRDGFVARYATREDVDGLPPGEGVFLACSFWLADNLWLQGRREEAERLFERLLSLRNDVGLLSEEYDPDTGRFLGNFPQAFPHVALVNSARSLSRGGGPAEDRPCCGEHAERKAARAAEEEAGTRGR